MASGRGAQSQGEHSAGQALRAATREYINKGSVRAVFFYQALTFEFENLDMSLLELLLAHSYVSTSCMDYGIIVS